MINLCAVALHLVVQQPSMTDAAFAREKVLLTAERNALAAEAKKLNAAIAQTAAAELETLAQRLSSLQTQNLSLERRVGDMGSENQGADLGVVTQKIAQRMRLDFSNPETSTTQIKTHLESVYAPVSVDHAPKTKVFDLNGEVFTSAVASLGTLAYWSLDATGHLQSLVPFDDGTALRMVKLPTLGNAQALGSTSQGPILVSALLLDPENPNQLPLAPKTWSEKFKQGGWVMWPILALGLIGILIALIRGFSLARHAMSQSGLESRIRACLTQHDAKGALEAVHQAKGSPLSEVAYAVFIEEGATQEQHEERAAEAWLRSKARTERGLTWLAVIAGAAPMLGLLGTVTGMIATFAVITEVGTGDPRALAGGISEALLTTQFGLVVAVPAMVMHALLQRTAHRLLSAAQVAGVSLIRQLAQPRHEAEHSLETATAPSNKRPTSSPVPGT